MNHHDIIGQMMGGGAVLKIHDTFTGSQTNSITGRSPDTVDNGQVWAVTSWATDDIGVDGGGAAKWYLVDSSIGTRGIETLGVENVYAEGIFQQTDVSGVVDATLIVRSKLNDFLNFGVWAGYENDVNIFRLRTRDGGAYDIDTASINMVEGTPFTIELTVTGSSASATITQGATTATISGACEPASGNSAAAILLRGGLTPFSQCNDFKITGL